METTRPRSAPASVDLTWQHLPPNLLTAVQRGHLQLWEAAGLMDCGLLTPEGEYRPLPPVLWAAAEKLWLLECRPTNRRQH